MDTLFQGFMYTIIIDTIIHWNWILSSQMTDTHSGYVSFSIELCFCWRTIQYELTLTRAASTLILREGWCLISSSMASPRLVAVSPIWSAPFFFLMAGRYSGEIRTPKRWSNGSALTKISSPRVLRHRALRMLGREASTYEHKTWFLNIICVHKYEDTPEIRNTKPISGVEIFIVIYIYMHILDCKDTPWK